MLATSGNRNANIAMAQPAVQLDLPRTVSGWWLVRSPAAACATRACCRRCARWPREEFVAPGFAEFAYEDSPLPIAER